MTLPTCHCHKPVRDGYLCHECTEQLGRNLLHLAEIGPALYEAAARKRDSSLKPVPLGGGWVGDRRAPVNEPALTALRHCYDTGCDISDALMAGFIPPARTLQATARLLLWAKEQVGMIRLNEHAVTIYDDVLDVMDECAKVLDLPREKKQSKETTDQRNQEAYHTLMPVAVACEWLRLYKGRNVPERTIRDWITKEKLPTHRDRRGLLVIPSTVMEVLNRRKADEVTAA